MSTIDQYVINQVLKNISYYVVPISINLSGSTFSDPKEHEIILDKLSTISQYASLVNFEITENEFIIIDKSLPFVEKLKLRFPQTPIELVDERFSSKIAFQTMIDGGLKKKARQNKGLIDQISATIILQTYLESNR